MFCCWIGLNYNVVYVCFFSPCRCVLLYFSFSDIEMPVSVSKEKGKRWGHCFSSQCLLSHAGHNFLRKYIFLFERNFFLCALTLNYSRAFIFSINNNMLWKVPSMSMINVKSKHVRPCRASLLIKICVIQFKDHLIK